MQESVEVDVAQLEGTAADVDAWRSRQAGSDSRRAFKYDVRVRFLAT
jgi:hypothetical protein